MANVDKIIKSKNQPKQTNVAWVDLSGEIPIEKHFINGRWAAVSGGGGGSIDISGKADKVSNATNGNFAGLDSNGNLTDSGKKASDFATSLQGAKADTAYQKPQTGIPESDLSAEVQQALQKHFKGWWPDLATLKAAHTATEGDSAYVKDASPATTWSIYVYDATATTDNNWADSGTDADTSNVQTFASGEEVNEVHIVNDLTTGGIDDVLSAEQGKIIGTIINQTTKVPIIPNITNGRRVKNSDRSIVEVTGELSTVYNMAYFSPRVAPWILHIDATIDSSSYPTGGIAFVDNLDEAEVGDVVSLIREGSSSQYTIDSDFTIPTGKYVLIFELRKTNYYFNYYEQIGNSKIGNLTTLETKDKSTIVNAINEVCTLTTYEKQTKLDDFDVVSSLLIKQNYINEVETDYYKVAYFNARQESWILRVVANDIDVSGQTGAIAFIDDISEITAGTLLAPIVLAKKGGVTYSMDEKVLVPAGKIAIVFQVYDSFSYYEVEKSTPFVNESELYGNVLKSIEPTKIYGRYLNASNVVKESTAEQGTAFNIAYFAAREADWKANIIAKDINGSVKTGAIVIVDRLDELDINDTISDENILVPSKPASTDYSMDEVVTIPANKILAVFEMDMGSKFFNYYEITGQELKTDLLNERIDVVSDVDIVTDNPLEVIKETPGYTAIFRSMGIIGGSMSSGSHHVNNMPTKTFYDYSPLQFMARMCGSEGFNFSYGGAMARTWELNTNRGGASDLFLNNPVQMYIVQLGNNDVSEHNSDASYVLGTTADLAGNNGVWPDTYFGHMGKIIQTIRDVQPNAYVFLSTFYRGYGVTENTDFNYNQAIRDIVAYYQDENNRPSGDKLHYYLLDLYKYGKRYAYYNKGVHTGTVNGSHLTSTGYLLTSYQLCTYIDWIIKNNMSDFNAVAYYPLEEE